MRLILATVLSSALLASATAADPVDDYVRSQLKARNLPGLSLAVVKDGRIVKSQTPSGKRATITSSPFIASMNFLSVPT